MSFNNNIISMCSTAMEYGHDFCSETSSPTDEVSENVVGAELKKLIRLYESCPALWNPNNLNYLNKGYRNNDLDRLLRVYKKIKPNSTRIDVRKKINSIRSNYRKELNKIEQSKGTGNIYKPTSWMFHALTFLSKIEKPVLTNGDSSQHEKQKSVVFSSMTNEGPPLKIIKKGSIEKQNVLLTKACDLLSLPTNQCSHESIHPVAVVWSAKFKLLDPTQALYAEKIINTVLFEAQFNNLHRDSMQINSNAMPSSSTTSTTRPNTPSPTVYQTEVQSPVVHITENSNFDLDTLILTPTQQSYKPISSNNALQIIIKRQLRKINIVNESNLDSEEYSVLLSE